jgi:3-hydroxybutyryl-CoA dehydrogenase
MGRGIAVCAAQHGITTSLYDTSDAALAAAREVIARHLERASTHSVAEPSSVELTASLDEAVAGADLVIESVPEVTAIKAAVYEAVGPLIGDHVVLATNTSTGPITELASLYRRPEAFVGLHFFNPPPVMDLVEVIPAIQTADWTLATALRFVGDLGKQATLSHDVAGFIATRGHVAQFLECARIVEEGVAGVEDVDATFRLGFRHPMGPLELADYIGLDILLDVAEGMRKAHGERFRPPAILRRLVEAGHLGRKTGRGFYEHPSGGNE